MKITGYCEDCSKPLVGKKPRWCKEHCYLHRRIVRIRKRIPLADRFWSKVNKYGLIPSYKPKLGPCWIWTAKIGGQGYGWIGNNGETAGGFYAAHRVAYELCVGPIPKGLELDHLCRVRICVNPNHLEPVTGRENKLRGIAPCAKNAKKTHCPNGHPYTEENTIYQSKYYPKTGHTTHMRICRECRRESMRINGSRYYQTYKSKKALKNV